MPSQPAPVVTVAAIGLGAVNGPPLRAAAEVPLAAAWPAALLAVVLPGSAPAVLLLAALPPALIGVASFAQAFEMVAAVAVLAAAVTELVVVAAVLVVASAAPELVAAVAVGLVVEAEEPVAELAVVAALSAVALALVVVVVVAVECSDSETPPVAAGFHGSLRWRKTSARIRLCHPQCARTFVPYLVHPKP